MKNSLIKSLFNKNIKQHLSLANWQLKNGLIYNDVKERGLLKGFCFNSSAFSATSFEIVVFVLPIYIPKEHLALTFGHF